MPVTTLAFFRKRQTLDHLESERPKSLHAVRQALHEAADLVEFELEQVERVFYGNAHPETDIRKWTPTITTVMKYTDLKEIKLAWQFEKMLEKAQEPGKKEMIGQETVVILKDCIDKITNATPHMFFGILKSVSKIHTYLQRYCLSFCSIKRSDPLLETALHYEMNIRDYSETISKLSDGIFELTKNFKTIGLDIAQFSLGVKEIARRCDCASIPFVLMFPEACEQIRLALKTIRRWLETDEQYPTFIRNDVIDLEKKQTMYCRLFRENQEKLFQLEYRMRQAKKDLADTATDVDKLMRKNAAFQDREAKLLAQFNSLKLELEIKEARRVDRSAHMRSTDHTEVFDKLVNEINSLRERISATWKTVEQVQLKMRVVGERRDQMEKVKDRARTVKSELRELRADNKSYQMELDRINECLAYLKRIHLLKSSPEVLKKVFHNMPLLSNAELMARKKSDQLERASRAASKVIDHDWKKLYRVLPFVPPRGEEMLHNDIDQIDKGLVRGTRQDLTLEALRRWRRVHIRASLDDLRHALQMINRFDALFAIEEALKPKPKPKPPPPRAPRRPLLMKVFAF